MTCMKNSSVIMPTLVTAAIGYGIFRVTPFRAQAKYAALIGGTLGMISSRILMSQLCLAKVASMPNSNLREKLIQAGYYKDNRPMSEQHRYRFQPMDVQSKVHSSEDPSTNIVFDDYPPMNSYDTYSSLNDNSDFRPSEDTDLSEPLNMQKNISYDELRHKNREEYYKKNKQWYTPPAERPPAANETTRRAPTTSASSMEEKNKYGDVWD
ncbi:OCIA domain-containing protein 1 isoform X2 [Linepithema humile]|nr:PREDICTED: OCIA domain-containing protein 1 isoform X2 [Linepithema humile]